MDEAVLWAAIEVAGPAATLTIFDPLTVDDIVQAERTTTQHDRRKSFVASYSWAVPTRIAINRICDLVGKRNVLEVCAGNGLWAHLLSNAGACVVATDQMPLPEPMYHGVEVMEAEAAVQRYPDCQALLLCWPPFKDDCAFRVLRAFQGDRLAYVGDIRFTADRQFHALLKASWKLIDETPLPSWPGTTDYARLYSRADGTLDATVAGIEP